ncbi:HU family DNA-binding protein [Candidatus Cardinium hertigii]|uniref:HU family DNA-binding protein n=1 Tax=Candidatus Cardinium hertigii TaxID=247481 RepID=UPI003D7EDA04
MTTTEVISAIARKTGIDRKDIRKTVKALLQVIEDAVIRVLGKIVRKYTLSA